MVNNITIEGTRLIFRNFAGNPDNYNKTGGLRTTGVLIPNEEAEALKAEGWNIKYLKPRDDQDEPQAFLTVKCKFGKIQPNIFICTERGTTRLDEETVQSIDYAEIRDVDIIIRPYEYEPGNISAYIKTLYVNIIEDEFAAKYAKKYDLNEED